MVFNEKDKYTEDILHVTQQLFKEKGIEAVSMRQIAQTVGIGQGTLYRRFSHKGELCMALVKDSANAFISQLETYTNLSQVENTDKASIETVLQKLIDFIDESCDLLIVINGYYAEKKRFTYYHNSVFQQLHTIIRSLLKTNKKGALSEVQLTIRTNMIIACLSPELYLYQREQGITKQDILANVHDLFF